jgi:hypothetical protein
VRTIKYVSLFKYQYILTDNKAKFGYFHALMPALYLPKAAPYPDAHLKTPKTNAKELDIQSQAQWPRPWSALQDHTRGTKGEPTKDRIADLLHV